MEVQEQEVFDMFRPMAKPRAHQQIPEEECIRILKEQKRGILCVLGDDDYPYGTPTNHFYSEEDGKIYFHSNKKGHKVDAMKKHDKVCFVCYDEGFVKEGDWALNIKSVIVFGRVEFIEDTETIIKVMTDLSHKFTDDEEYIAKEMKTAAGTLLFAIKPEHMTGKLVNES